MAVVETLRRCLAPDCLRRSAFAALCAGARTLQPTRPPFTADQGERSSLLAFRGCRCGLDGLAQFFSCQGTPLACTGCRDCQSHRGQ
eukprot:2105701-Alexandrium_andersonii.AAC.1